MQTPKIDIDYSVKGCVFKLFWGEKYVIIKCHLLARAKTNIETSLSYHLKTGMHDKLYEKFFDYIKSHPFYSFSVEILFQSDNPYQLLVHEQIELDKAKQDHNCMNTSFDAYVPKKIQGNRKAWVNRGHYLNFMQWLKKYRENQVN